jgi:hypothetical protein
MALAAKFHSDNRLPIELSAVKKKKKKKLLKASS